MVRREDRAGDAAPAVPGLLAFVLTDGDSRMVATIVEAVAAVDPETLRDAAAEHGGPDAFPNRVREAVTAAYE